MKCSKCGAELKDDSKFCVKCGANIDEKKETKKVETKKASSGSFDFVAFLMGCLTFILGVILKPISALKNKIKDYADLKSAGLFLLVVSFGRMIINLISNMISVIFVKTTNYFTGDTKFEVVFGNLKDLDYLSLIFKEFFIFIVTILAIAGIYYIVAMIMKKTANYFRLVTVTTVSFIPFIVVSSLVATIVGYIYVPLALFLTFGSFVYSIMTFVPAMDSEISIDDSNLHVYFHSICLTVIFIVLYYVALNSLSSALSLTNLLK